ncbi:MAG: hypothetical protein ACRDRN_13975 [Sciscionella sp.]
MSGSFDVHLPSLDEYVGKNGQLGDDVRNAASDQLAGLRSLPADMLGNLGHENGLHGHLISQISKLHDHVHATADSIHRLGGAVKGARSDYDYNEEDHGSRFDRINKHA